MRAPAASIVVLLSAGLVGSPYVATGADQRAVARAAVRLGDAPIEFRPTVPNDTLWDITRPIASSAGVAQNRLMIAILRANPDAFLGGNVFFLRIGVVLTLPSFDAVLAEDPAQAESTVIAHQRSWQSGHAAAPALYPAKSREQVSRAPEPAGDATTSPTAPPTESVPPTPAVPPPTSAAPSSSASAPPPAPPAPPPAPAAGEPAPSTPSIASSSTPESSRPASDGVASSRREWPMLATSAVAVGLGLLLLVAFGNTRTRREVALRNVLPSSEHRDAPTPPRVIDPPRGSSDFVLRVDASGAAATVILPGVQEPPDADELKIKLAKAYLELERRSDAVALLREVADGASSALRHEAERLLQPIAGRS